MRTTAQRGRKEEQSGRRKDGAAGKQKANGKCATPTRGARTFPARKEETKKQTHINDLQRLDTRFRLLCIFKCRTQPPMPRSDPLKCVARRQLSAQTKPKCDKKWLKQMRRRSLFPRASLIFICAIFSWLPFGVQRALASRDERTYQQLQRQQQQH